MMHLLVDGFRIRFDFGIYAVSHWLPMAIARVSSGSNAAEGLSPKGLLRDHICTSVLREAGCPRDLK
jgi:hypothetical protein